jgi:hypothetical protein
MDYYRLESDIKTYKPTVIKWMTDVGCAKSDIVAFKKVKDNRISTTMGAVAACLNRGMTPQRPGFNSGRDTAAWLRAEIVKVLAEGADDIDPETLAAEKEAAKKDVYTSMEALIWHFKIVMGEVDLPKGEVYHSVEGGNGELGYYLISDGGRTPYRLHFRRPCFIYYQAYPEMIKGSMLSDAILTMSSMNVIAGELDA